jgi:hypothetical protein
MKLYSISSRYKSGTPKHLRCSFCDHECYYKEGHGDSIKDHLETHLTEISDRYKCKKCSFFGITLDEIQIHKRSCKKDSI